MIDGDNRVCHINGRPEAKAHLAGESLMFTGLQVISPQIFADIPPAQHCSTTAETYPKLIARGAAVYGYRHDGYWMDIGVPTRYRQAHWDFLDGVFRGPISVRDGTHLIRRAEDTPAGWAHVNIHPPVMVGARVELAAGACIGPYAVIGPGCQVEVGASVRESVLWEGVRVASYAQVDRCILGTGVAVPAHRVVSDAIQITTSEASV
jgi:NDP-sugar pyrophosphorylase family protein